MKKIFIIAIAAVTALSCTGKKAGYTITVDCQDPDFTSFILTDQDRETPLSDTVAVVDGKATFTGKVDGFDVRYVLARMGEAQPIFVKRVFLENAEYTVTVPEGFSPSIPSELVSNSKLQMQVDSVQNLISAIYEGIDMKQLQKEFKNGNQAVRDSISTLLDELSDKASAIEEKFMTENPLSPMALEMAASSIRYIGLDSAKKVAEKFEAVPEYASNRIFKNIQKEVAKKEALAPGKQAPDFTLNTPDGTPVKFSEVYPQNKVTMVDFWASWCGPCRKFNPTLTKIYAKYSKKGFGILGVSLDREKDKWLEAIKADKLVWKHVSDLQYWDSQAAKLYNISFIPQSYFVDSQGTILLASPEEDQIESFLEEYLK